MNKPKNLFILTFIAIFTIYLYIFGQIKTLELIKEQYLFILVLFSLTILLIYFKIKLKGYEIVNFNANNQLSLKSAILFFLLFQVIDYYNEEGFIGMISQWFLYWIMGVIALLLMENINYYKNYKIRQRLK
ncbi:hypothetical protein [Malaciobacter mytili]|uniref:Uncharacterized protein n=1 Tax=Malaciobacter mytili LMG 24559 TaxID=1032238 RepID=A0AAX2AH56_9BACT|nr:hypothetical protein [Malaciobacter mytili]AXH15357.1 putative membrane protein [Malaciobacter mytili LMG 24559]RXI43651.1 hypothetical protein CRU99_06885 [Malaciobacter mytili]RXK15363.1 hypothetical protein CP985_08925 [Malaciobacter mytili LMG 24559]